MIPLLKNPDLTFFHYMDRRVRYTPDAADLFQYQHKLLFVCDDHMSKHRSFPKMLKFGPTLFPNYSNYPVVFTMGGFNLFHDRETGLVVPLHATTDTLFPCAKIKGQLHRVTPDLIHSLDSAYQNGVLFNRRRVKLLLPYTCKPKQEWKTLNGKPLPKALQGWRQKQTTEKIHIIEAHMYVGRQSYWMEKLDGGYNTLQCPILFPNVEKNWLPRYYEFTRTFEESQHSWQKAQRSDR